MVAPFRLNQQQVAADWSGASWLGNKRKFGINRLALAMAGARGISGRDRPPAGRLRWLLVVVVVVVLPL